VAQIDVVIINTLNGEEFDVNLPDDQKMADLIGKIVENIEIEDQLPQGESWKLINKSQNFEYMPDHTLAQAGNDVTSAGDKLGVSHGAAPGISD